MSAVPEIEFDQVSVAQRMRDIPRGRPRRERGL